MLNLNLQFNIIFLFSVIIFSIVAETNCKNYYFINCVLYNKNIFFLIKSKIYKRKF